MKIHWLIQRKNDYYGIIYVYVNRIDYKMYIGKTTKPIEERHRLHRSQRYNSYFHNALAKYGEDTFLLFIIDFADNADDLNKKERYWISRYNSNVFGYNLTVGGDGCAGYKHDNDTIEKLRRINTGKNNPMYGKKHSAESRRKLSKSHIGINKGRIVSEETRAKLKESKIGRYSGKNNPMYGKHHTIESKDKIRKNRNAPQNGDHIQAKRYAQLTMDGTLIKYYSSGSEASAETGCDRSDISKCCKGKITHSHGFKWMYADEYKALEHQ